MTDTTSDPTRIINQIRKVLIDASWIAGAYGALATQANQSWSDLGVQAGIHEAVNGLSMLEDHLNGIPDTQDSAPTPTGTAATCAPTDEAQPAMVTLAEASKLTRIPRRTISGKINRGEIPGAVRGPRDIWLIPANALPRRAKTKARS